MARTVLIVEDDQRIRHRFERAIRDTVDLRIAGIAADLPEGRELLDATTPDVLLVDLGLPSGSGIELIRHAQSHQPLCESMVVTVFADEQAVLACIEAGATGYLLKDARPVDIVEQIRLLCAGGSPISPTVARRLMLRVGAMADQSAGAAAAQALVSTQERQVLVLSSKGYGYEEIAGMMGLSRHTVETYVKRIYRKLQVHSKTEAVYEARKLGIVHD